MTYPEEVEEQENEEQEITYAEILSAAILNTDVIITVISQEVDKIKTGLKNLKAKQNTKLREEGLAPGNEIIEFQELPSTSDGYTDLRIIMKQKATIKIKKMVLPDNNF